jgi:hypothetical protein
MMINSDDVDPPSVLWLGDDVMMDDGEERMA